MNHHRKSPCKTLSNPLEMQYDKLRFFIFPSAKATTKASPSRADTTPSPKTRWETAVPAPTSGKETWGIPRRRKKSEKNRESRSAQLFGAENSTSRSRARVAAT